MKSSRPISLGVVIIVLFVGIIAISTGSILVRLATDEAEIRSVGFSLVISAARLTFASLLLSPSWGKIQWRSLQPGAILFACLAGITLTFHFAAWITSLSYTSIAASTTLVTTTPIWVALISWIWLKQKPTKLTSLGIVIALAGGILISIADSNPGITNPNPTLGNILALIGAITASLYLMLGREAQQRGFKLGGYMTVAYSLAAVLLLPLPGLLNTSYLGYPNIVYFYLFLMAVLPQLVGHTSLNWAMNQVSPTIVALMTLCEPVGSSILGYFFFQEIPSFLVVIGAIVILIGVAIAVLGSKREEN
ncbi:MAG: DMT family transporter [Microcoleaceae cyanobacterium]